MVLETKSESRLLRSGVWFRGYPYGMWFGSHPLFPILERKTVFLVCYFGRFCHLKFSPENFLIVKIRTSHSKLSALYNAISIMQIEWELAQLQAELCVLCKTAKCGLLRGRGKTRFLVWNPYGNRVMTIPRLFTHHDLQVLEFELRSPVSPQSASRFECIRLTVLLFWAK